MSPSLRRWILLCAFIRLSLPLAGSSAYAEGLEAAPQVEVAQGQSPPRALAGFQKALEDLEAKKIDRVSVLQIGDSHTAGDHFSGRLRELLQQTFGNAGRGMMPAGYPFPYWRPYQAEVHQEGAWEVLSSNGIGYPQLPYGIAGFVSRSTRADNVMTLEAKRDSVFDSVEIGFFRQPNGGRFVVSIDGRSVQEIDTSGTFSQLVHQTIPTNGAKALELRTRDARPVDVADWAIYRRERGIVLSSFGFVGAQIGILDHWSPENLKFQLQSLAPALVILAFGTNEGFQPPSELKDYEAEFSAKLSQLQSILPRASIVVVGPPDGNRLPDYCGLRGTAREAAGCRPLSTAEAADYSGLLARHDRRLCRWHTPAGIALVRQAQQRVALKLGALFWDWSTVQGGACGANNWVPRQLERSDRVHMFERGYWMSADRLYSELLRGYRHR